RAVVPLGGASDFIVAWPGAMMDGAIRTDRSINLGEMFQKTFTVVVYHHQSTWRARPSFVEQINQHFAAAHPGVDRNKMISENFFSHIRNHWDMVYRALETSFNPGPARR